MFSKESDPNPYSNFNSAPIFVNNVLLSVTVFIYSVVSIWRSFVKILPRPF